MDLERHATLEMAKDERLPIGKPLLDGRMKIKRTSTSLKASVRPSYPPPSRVLQLWPSLQMCSCLLKKGTLASCPGESKRACFLVSGAPEPGAAVSLPSGRYRELETAAKGSPSAGQEGAAPAGRHIRWNQCG